MLELTLSVAKIITVTCFLNVLNFISLELNVIVLIIMK